MTIFEKARDLGETIMDTEQGKRATEARAAFDSDTEAQNILNSFTQYRNSIQIKAQKGELSQEEINEESKKINEMAVDVQKNPVIGELIKAESNLGIIVNEVMGIIRAMVDGEEEGGCGCSESGCSGCSGCH